jgi:hypothetical protein
MVLNHKKNIISAFRTALIGITGFIIYEILIELEKIWNYTFPNNEHYHFHKRRILHFLCIFLLDLLLIYIFFYLFNIEV